MDFESGVQEMWQSAWGSLINQFGTMAREAAENVRSKAIEFSQSETVKNAAEKIRETAQQARAAGENAYQRAVDFYYSDDVQAAKERMLEMKDNAGAYLSEAAETACEKVYEFSAEKYRQIRSLVVEFKGTLDEGNLMEQVQKTLAKKKDDAALQVVADTLNVHIKQHCGNVIKLDVFAEDDDGEAIEIEVKADCVSEELRDGRTFRMDMRRQEANPAAGVC